MIHYLLKKNNQYHPGKDADIILQSREAKTL